MNLLPVEAVTMLNSFTSDIVPTVLSLVTLIVPYAILFWVIGFALNYGMADIKKKAHATALGNLSTEQRKVYDQTKLRDANRQKNAYARKLARS